MLIKLPDLPTDAGPLYRRLAEAIAEAIRAGDLKPGSRLPSHRDLAHQLGLAVGTVSRAYVHLAERGMLRSAVGQGTSVLGGQEEGWIGLATNRSLVDMRLVTPPPLRSAALRQALKQGSLGEDDIAWERLELAAFPPETGQAHQREAAAAWCRAGGIPANPDSLIITGGGQEALLAVITAFARRNAPVLCEALTVVALKNLCTAIETPLRGVEMDGEGVLPAALEAAAKRSGTRLVILYPGLQVPTGARMGAQRRKEIAEVARRHDLLIVESEAYGRFLGKAGPSFTELIPERSFHLQSFSNVTLPGLRCGILHSPPGLLHRVTASHHATVLSTSSLTCEVAATWITSGLAERIVQAHRQELRARLAIVAEILPDLAAKTIPGAPFLWLTLPHHRAGDFVAQASANGVELLAADRFAVTRGPPPDAVRIAISTPPDRGSLERGLLTVKDLLRG